MRFSPSLWCFRKYIRKSNHECKGIFANTIDKIDNADYYSSKISLEEISEKKRETSRTINRNMENFDKKIPTNWYEGTSKNE